MMDVVEAVKKRCVMRKKPMFALVKVVV
jgi:hypothetical protein